MLKKTSFVSKFSVILLILFCSLGICNAERNIVYRVTAFSTDEVPKKSYRIGWDDHKIVTPRHSFVEPPRVAELRDSTFLDFYDPTAKASAEGIPPKPEFSVKIPSSSSTQCLILLFYIKDKVKPILLDFNKLNCKLGQELVFNMLSIPIATRFEDDNTGKKGEVVTIKNGQKKVLPKRIAKRGLRKFFFKNPKTKKTITFSSTMSFTNKNSRSITIVNPTSKTSLPALSTISIPKISAAMVAALREQQEQQQ